LRRRSTSESGFPQFSPFNRFVPIRGCWSSGTLRVRDFSSCICLGRRLCARSRPRYIACVQSREWRTRRAAWKRTRRSGCGRSLFATIGEAQRQTAVAPLRGHFTAAWRSVNGATGYRLDVSTNKSFSSYVSGYEDLDVGDVSSRTVSGLSPNTTYYYRVRAYSSLGVSGNSEVMAAIVPIPSSGLIINATFDSSITSDANSAAIESMISQAIATLQALFSDPITVSILFRYSDTGPSGNPPLLEPPRAKQLRFLYDRVGHLHQCLRRRCEDRE